ncbi:MAG TPA: hypothetical protein PKL92_02975 [Aquaticitalea sp.]|nr:hypothetical protein [Aquaticitalea sp.]
MIFRAFKEKSILKHVNKLLSSRTVAIHQRKIESVGVVLDINEYIDFESFRSLFKQMGLLSPKTKIIAFSKDEKEALTMWDTKFNEKDFGWKGTIKNIELQGFLDQEFDALICYYKHNSLYLNLIVATSKANLKIGLSNEDPRLFDIIFDIQPKDFKVFRTELIKYLTVLKKI